MQNTIILGLFAVVLLISVIRVYFGIGHKFIKNSCQKYFPLIFLDGAITGILGGFGIGLSNNWLLFFSVIGLTLSTYLNLAWVKLAVAPATNQSPKLIVRPMAFSLLLFTWLTETFCFIFAGPQNVQNLLITNPDHLVQNFWLCFGSIVVLSYAVFGQLLLIWELWQGAKIYHDSEGLEARYGFLTYAFGNALMNVQFFTGLFGLLIYGLFSWRTVWEIGAEISNVSNGIFILAMLINNFDRKFYKLYRSHYDKQTDFILEKLEPLYSRAIELYPTPYRRNAYNYGVLKSKDEILKSVVNTFGDYHIWFCRAEVVKLAKIYKIEVEKLPIKAKTSFAQDFKRWTWALNSQTTAKEILQLLDSVKEGNHINVPKIKTGRSNRQIAQYYVKMAEAISVLALPELMPNAAIVRLENKEKNRDLFAARQNNFAANPENRAELNRILSSLEEL